MHCQKFDIFHWPKSDTEGSRERVAKGDCGSKNIIVKIALNLISCSSRVSRATGLRDVRIKVGSFILGEGKVFFFFQAFTSLLAPTR